MLEISMMSFSTCSMAQKAYHWDDVYSAISEICVHAPPRILSWRAFDLFSAFLSLTCQTQLFNVSHRKATGPEVMQCTAFILRVKGSTLSAGKQKLSHFQMLLFTAGFTVSRVT